MFNSLKFAAIGAIAAFGIAGFAQADTVLQSGTTVDGWTITFPAGIGLVVDSTLTNSSTLALEKFPEFVNSQALPITFTQSGTASSQIDLVDEQITNLSGSTWSGFQYQLANVSGTMGAGSVSFDVNSSIPSPFAPPDGYTGVTVNSSTLITYAGSQASGVTSQWGFGADGDLIINADPSAVGTTPQDFMLNESPMGGGSVTPPGVPLASAAWQSIVGLMGLGLIGLIKKARKIA